MTCNRYKTIKTAFVVLLFFLPLFPTATVGSQAALFINESSDVYQLGHYLEIAEDQSANWTIEDFLAGQLKNVFIPNQKSIPNMGYTKSIHWIRFSVFNELAGEAAQQDWILFIDDAFITDIALYEVVDGRVIKVHKTGNIIPFAAREVNHRKYAFKIKLKPFETKTFYLRHYDRGLSILPISLMSEDYYLRFTQKDYLTYGMYFGVFFLLIVVNLVLFIIIRDKHYFLYTLLLIGAVVNFALMYGFLNQFVWPGAIEKSLNYSGLIVSLGGVTGLLFSINFLNLKTDLPVMHKVLLGFVAIYFVWGAFSVFLPPKPGMLFTMLLLSVHSAILFGACIHQVIKGYKPAVYWLIGTSISILAMVVSLLTRNEIMVMALSPDDLTKISTIFRLIVFSIAIETKLHQIEKEKEKAERLAITNLKKADQLKNMFLANTSHELRTPLHGMVGLADALLRNEQLSSNVYGDLTLIATSGRRLANLVDDILDFSRIKSDELNLVLRPVNLYETAAATIKLIQPLVDQKDLTFINLINPDGPAVQVDENRLRQILNNLIGNAAKFTETGHIKIEASLRGTGLSKEKDSKDYMEIRVSDTGIGIRKEDQGRIFNLFEQADGALNRDHQGTGLGLAITRKLVELHHGEVWVESFSGTGSSFIFTLPVSQFPVAKSASDNPDKKKMSSKQAGNSADAISPESDLHTFDVNLQGQPHILLVDDDPVNIKILERFLSKQHCRLSIAWNGIMALELIQKQSFDLVLLDIMMPGISGYEVCRRIREKHSEHELPVMMLTAKIHLSEVEEGFRSGANDYVQKPFIFDELIRRINNVLSAKDTNNESRFSLGKKGDDHLFISNEVKYLSSAGKQSIVHTVNQDYNIPVMLKNVEQELPNSFIRIHRQYIVNIGFISRIFHIGGGRYKMELKDKPQTELVVSRTYVSSVRNKLQL